MSENITLDHCATVHLWQSQHHPLLAWWWLAFTGSTMFGQQACSWATCRRFLTAWVVTQTSVALKAAAAVELYCVPSLKAFVTSKWWRLVVERGCPFQGKLVTFPIRWWWFLLMRDFDMSNCLVTLSRILPFWCIPMALHLKCCMAAVEDRNSINVGLRIS